MTEEAGLPTLPARDPAGHKGTFGSVCVVAGHAAPPTMMLGSAVLVSLGALRAGAALCAIAAPEPLLPEMLRANPSATGIPLPVDATGEIAPSAAAERLDAVSARFSAYAVGPGLGTSFAAQQVVLRMVARESTHPHVLDADALNCLSLSYGIARDLRVPAVLTPHPLEFARLAQALGMQHGLEPPATADRVFAAAALAQRMGAVVALKGHRTVVSDGMRHWVCSRGNDALAVGGSGDVLTGIIAGFLAQWAAPVPRARGAAEGRLDLFACSCLAVEVHARAAERWSARTGGTAGMLASELAAEVPAVLPELRGS